MYLIEEILRININFCEVEKDFKANRFKGKPLGGDILAFRHEVKRYILERFNKDIDKHY